MLQPEYSCQPELKTSKATPPGGMAHPAVPFAFVLRMCSLSWSLRFQMWSPSFLVECMTSSCKCASVVTSTTHHLRVIDWFAINSDSVIVDSELGNIFRTFRLGVVIVKYLVIVGERRVF